MLKVSHVGLMRHGHTEDLPVVTDISFVVEPGSYVALAGPNGSGKSSLASLLCAEVLADEGAIEVDGYNPAASIQARHMVRSKVGLVRQHPLDQLICPQVVDEIAFGPRNLGLNETEVAQRVDEALDAVGLLHTKDMLCSELSGGQQQLLCIAGVLAMRPSYLVLDEASSMLDVQARATLRSYVSQLVQTYNVGVVVISHDAEDVLAAQSLLTLRDGRLGWQGSPQELMMHQPLQWDACVSPSPRVEVLRVLQRVLQRDLSSYELANPLACIQKIWADNPQSSLVAELAHVLDTRGARDVLDVLPASGALPVLDAFVVPDASPASDAPSAPRVHKSRVEDHMCKAHLGSSVPQPEASGLEIRGVDLFWGAHHALQAVDLVLPRGAITLIAGRSGSGKTSLACVASGLQKPQKGSVTWENNPVEPGGVALALQAPEEQMFCDTVWDEIAFAARQTMSTVAQIETATKRAARAAGIDEALWTRSPFELSGGQARRVGVASVLSLNAPVLILDEPTAGLDVSGRAALHHLVRQQAAEGRAVAVISHDLDEWLAVATHSVLVDQGCIAWAGSCADLLEHSELFEQVGLLVPFVAAARRLFARMGCLNPQKDGRS